MDKVVHSAVGVGFYLSALVTLNYWVLIALVATAILKEIIDLLRYGHFDLNDIFATLNPLVVIKWYLNAIK